MARIELSFNDKNYTIEYDRASIREFLKHKDEGDEIEQIINLVKCGLTKHHKDDMPSDDDIFGWVMAMGESVKDFAEALHEMVQGVLDTFKTETKNLKWEKVA